MTVSAKSYKWQMWKFNLRSPCISLSGTKIKRKEEQWLLFRTKKV